VAEVIVNGKSPHFIYYFELDQINHWTFTRLSSNFSKPNGEKTYESIAFLLFFHLFFSICYKLEKMDSVCSDSATS
jgi:hypothetical protein